MSSSRLARRAGSALCVLALLAAGCTGPSAEPARGGAGADQPHLSAVAVYGRHAAVRGKVDVRIANLGPGPAEIERYRVEHPMFAPVPAVDRRSVLPPDGRLRIVPVPFGAPRCEVQDARGARVVVGLRTADGVHDVAVPLADGTPGLERAHRLSCAAAEVEAAASIELTPWSVQPGPAARTALRLHRRGPGEVVITTLGGTVLFSVDVPDHVPLLRLPEDQVSAEVEVRVLATRCQAHALTEAKRVFTFPVFAAVGGGDLTPLEVTAGGPGRAALQDLLDRTCGPGG
jgi:hypothetical protein